MTKIAAALALSLLLLPSRSEADLNIGAEAGFTKRSADHPSNFGMGLGYGFHVEVGGRVVQVGPYYFHGDLPAKKDPESLYDGAFHAAGVRARFNMRRDVLKPYGYVGLGYVWMSHGIDSDQSVICAAMGCSFPPPGPASGHFFEVPLGIGAALVFTKDFQMYFDFAFRPGFGFGGEAYSNSASHNAPVMGWSVVMGLALTPP